MKKNKLKLVTPICPSNNHYLDYKVMNRGSKNIVFPYPTNETKEFKKNFITYIQNEVKKQGWVKDESGLQHYYVNWNVYFPRVDMDAANYDKVIADSITESKVVWVDDNVVCNHINHIYYDNKNPHFELEIYPVDYIGIFDNEAQLCKFEDKCKTCNRYSRNCSLLKNAKLGKIQDDIEDLSCKKYKEIKH